MWALKFKLNATQKGYLFCSKSLLMISLANLPLSSSKDCQNGCPFQDFFIIVKLQKVSFAIQSIEGDTHSARNMLDCQKRPLFLHEHNLQFIANLMYIIF